MPFLPPTYRIEFHKLFVGHLSSLGDSFREYNFMNELNLYVLDVSAVT